jgi:hypothetical protein
MMLRVRTLPEAFGLRPTASTAFPPIIPIPMAAAAPAMARVKLPVIPPAVAAASAMSCGIILLFPVGFFSTARSLCHGPGEKSVKN